MLKNITLSADEQLIKKAREKGHVAIQLSESRKLRISKSETTAPTEHLTMENFKPSYKFLLGARHGKFEFLMFK